MFLFAFISLLISSAGLNAILAVSGPVLNAIYPVAIVLIALAFLEPFTEKWSSMYSVSILFTAVVSVIYALEKSGILLPVVSPMVSYLPGYGMGLGWIDVYKRQALWYPFSPQ